MYTVKVFRHEYVLYAAWEYGFRLAIHNIKMRAFPRGVTTFFFKRRRDADAFAQRVALTAAWQRGRLGMANKSPDVFVH